MTQELTDADVKSYNIKNVIAGSWSYFYHGPPAMDTLGQEAVKLMKHKYLQGDPLSNIIFSYTKFSVGKFDGISKVLVEKGFKKVDLSELASGKIRLIIGEVGEDIEEPQDNDDDGIVDTNQHYNQFFVLFR